MSSTLYRSFNVELSLKISGSYLSSNTISALESITRQPIGSQIQSAHYVPKQDNLVYHVKSIAGYLTHDEDDKKTPYIKLQNNLLAYTPKKEEIANPQKEYFTPIIFLRQDRPKTRFTRGFDEVEKHVKKIFREITGNELPKDIVINIVPKEQLRKVHQNIGGIWSDGIHGFCINRKPFDFTTIFAKENNLDELLVTLGHEIGHALSVSKKDKTLEEAKAFAFEMEWLKIIYEKNIANLRKNININVEPANNGLHDKAFAFVKRMMDEGFQPIEIFNDIIEGKICSVSKV